MNSRKLGLMDIIARLMLAILFLLFLAVSARFLTRQILIKRFGMDNAFTRAVNFDAPNLDKGNWVDVDWSTQYPFNEERSVAAPAADTKGRLISALNRYTGLVAKVKDKLVPYTARNLVFYRRFAELSNRVERLAGWNLVPGDEYNAVVFLDEGYLLTPMPKRSPEGNILALAGFKDYLDTLDIPLLYVQVPSKLSGKEAGISDVIDFSNANADALLAGLKERGISCLDLREAITAQGLDHRDLYYRTDHHWKAETGLWAAGVISGYLNDRAGFRIDPGQFEQDAYEARVYKDRLLGSQGRKVTLSRAAPEDFTLLYPRFRTDLSLTIRNRGIDTRGGFDIIYDLKPLAEEDVYNANLYTAYLHDDNALTQLRNHLTSDKKKVLLIGESNDNVIVPFLATGLAWVDSVDLRHFNGSVRSLVEQNRYDLVIISYSPLVVGLHSAEMVRLFNFK